MSALWTLGVAARPGQAGRCRWGRGEGRVCAPDCAPRPSTECRPILRIGSTGSGPQPAVRYGLAGFSS